MTDPVLVHVEDRVATLTVNDPERRNAVTAEISAALRAAVDAAEADPGVHALIVTGAGKAFCAGADLSALGEATEDGLMAIYDGFLAVANCALPTIAAVNGAAYAGGCELALHADFIYASRTARFALTEVTLGIMPGSMGTQNLPLAVGERRAKEIILTGRPFTAEEAYAWGLVNRVCEPEALINETLETAHCIASNAPLSLMRAKRAISVATQVDRHEGILAFNKKRKPNFKGSIHEVSIPANVF